MDVTYEFLGQILAKLEKESEFTGYSFTLDKDYLSMDGEQLHQDDIPWNVRVRVNEVTAPILVIFKIDAKNPMNSTEFEEVVRAKVSGAIKNATK